MNSNRSSRPSTEQSRVAAFSLIELLATMSVTGLVLAGVIQFFSYHAHAMRSHGFRIETQQALRGGLEAIARDVRLAGACLPQNGAFVALDGTDEPAGDSITVRMGIVRNDLSCVFYQTRADAAKGSTTFQLSVPAGQSVNGFVVDKMAYIRDPNGSGELRRVTGSGATSVSVSPGAGQDYPSGSTVYAVDQRIYAVDTGADPPILNMTVDEQDPLPFAAGIYDLQMRYVLDRNCPPCDVVDLSTPLSTADWWRVNEVLISATGKTVGSSLAADQATLTETVRAKPRNLLP